MDNISENRSFGKLVSLLDRSCRSYIRKMLKPLELGFGQLQIIRAIYKYSCMTQADISAHTGTDKSTTARNIEKLLEEGYLKRKRNPENRRAYIISLTGKGNDSQDEIMKILSGLTESLTGGFSETEKDQAFTFLLRMLDNLSEKRIN